MRRPKASNEKRAYGKAMDAGVKVRGKRKPKNLPSDWDDKNIESNWKKQNAKRKPSRKTIRRPEEDAESYKDFKKKGKSTMKGPEVKERKRFAPTNQVHKPKKGKGSYDRNKAKQVNESQDISKFIEALITKNYSDANKYLKQAVNSKIEKKIEKELNTPLF